MLQYRPDKSILITNSKSDISRILYSHEKVIPTHSRLVVIKALASKIQAINQIYQANPSDLDSIKAIAATMYEVFSTLDTNPKKEHMERMLLACLGILDMHNPISWERYADGVQAIVDGLKIGNPYIYKSI